MPVCACLCVTVTTPTRKREREAEVVRHMKAVMSRTVEDGRHSQRTLLSLSAAGVLTEQCLPRHHHPRIHKHTESVSALAALAEMSKEVSGKRLRCASAPGRHARFERCADQVVEKKAGKRDATTSSSGPGALFTAASLSPSPSALPNPSLARSLSVSPEIAVRVSSVFFSFVAT